MKVALYARVSTDSQDPEVQLHALRTLTAQRGWEIVEEFVDRGYSGAKESRPALDQLMRAAWAGRFQAVLVWRFDRFARSVKHLVTALDTFRSRNVAFISLQEQLDTSSPSPIERAMFTIIGAMAQLERDIIREPRDGRPRAGQGSGAEARSAPGPGRRRGHSRASRGGSLARRDRAPAQL